VIIILVGFCFDGGLGLRRFWVFLVVFLGDDVFLERAILSSFGFGVCPVLHGSSAVNFNNLI
jgi:hypothetical protein